MPRRDGHPPLFYLLLHGWIAAVGDSDLAVRALSGLWAVALLPLVWIAGRRVGGRRTAACTVVILALSPFTASEPTRSPRATSARRSASGWENAG